MPIFFHLLVFGLLRALVYFSGTLGLFYALDYLPSEGLALSASIILIVALILFCGHVFPSLFLWSVPARCRECQGVAYGNSKTNPLQYECHQCGASQKTWYRSS
jgi:hypothetical protein